MNKLVSVVIPVYNVESYIVECLESVVNQTYRSVEIILIDDGSTDNSGKVCDDYDRLYSNVKVIHKENGGQGAARNIGISCSQGEYVYFLDSDDYISKDLVEKCYHAAEKYKSDIVTFNTEVIADDDAIVLHTYSRALKPYTKYSNKELFNFMVANEEFCPTVWLYFYRLDFLTKNKHYFIEKYIYEDVPFTFIGLHFEGATIYMPDKLIFHRFNQSSVMGKKATCFNIVSKNSTYKYLNDFYLSQEKRDEDPYQLILLKWLVSTTIPYILTNSEHNKESRKLVLDYIKFIATNRHLISLHLGRSIFKVMKGKLTKS